MEESELQPTYSSPTHILMFRYHAHLRQRVKDQAIIDMNPDLLEDWMTDSAMVITSQVDAAACDQIEDYINEIS